MAKSKTSRPPRAPTLPNLRAARRATPIPIRTKSSQQFPSVDITRATKRPTVAFNQFIGARIHEVVLGVFKKTGYDALDMEALVFFVLTSFDVTAATYEQMHKTVKAHILKNFAIHQGAYMEAKEVRRITVLHTIEQDQDD
jgi:hypothetical protein